MLLKQLPSVPRNRPVACIVNRTWSFQLAAPRRTVMSPAPSQARLANCVPARGLLGNRSAGIRQWAKRRTAISGAVLRPWMTAIKSLRRLPVYDVGHTPFLSRPVMRVVERTSQTLEPAAVAIRGTRPVDDLCETDALHMTPASKLQTEQNIRNTDHRIVVPRLGGQRDGSSPRGRGACAGACGAQQG